VGLLPPLVWERRNKSPKFGFVVVSGEYVLANKGGKAVAISPKTFRETPSPSAKGKQACTICWQLRRMSLAFQGGRGGGQMGEIC